MSEVYLRSRLMMSPDDTSLLVVDVQEKLLNVIPDRASLVWNIQRLLEAAVVLDVRRIATEQYPEKLGSTTRELQPFVQPASGKITFSCVGDAPFYDQLKKQSTTKVLVAGIESHVCVLQTVLDLIAAGYDVYVPVDAVASRFEVDYQTALKRMESSGATLVTTEMALFEWCQAAGSDRFKQISQLVRREKPSGRVDP
ncbi:MAG: isochorismatase family protein [Planctomycetaceae bacterium]|nr:isochorismatase family protein [Planctomycetaceae bacterium]